MVAVGPSFAAVMLIVAVSLAVLHAAELISSQKSGRVVTHRLQRDPLRRYQAWLTRRTAFWNEQLDALAEAFVAP